MSSNFPWQYGSDPAFSCDSCVASHPYLCDECQANLYEPLNFDGFLDNTAEAPGYLGSHTQGFGAFSTVCNPTLPLPSQESSSLPDLAAETSYRNNTESGANGLTTEATASRPRYYSASARGSDSRRPTSGLGNTPHIPRHDLEYNIAPNYGYQTLTYSSATDIAEMNCPTLQADQSRQFRCSYPSKLSAETTCGASFAKNKDLGRHVRSVHTADDEPVYRCKCSHENVRKDNYMRHLRRCTKGHELRTFSCICGIACGDKMDHVAHLGLCGGRT
ncbi:hypothetical protein BJ166DRAFT_299521 [Pestalotiopsis sp. NC0098]|nr:hypothetical protein BJ166DRAFT_299521 [Pestalotiopsis sp. NC0098]